MSPSILVSCRVATQSSDIPSAHWVLLHLWCSDILPRASSDPLLACVPHLQSTVCTSTHYVSYSHPIKTVQCRVQAQEALVVEGAVEAGVRGVQWGLCPSSSWAGASRCSSTAVLVCMSCLPPCQASPPPQHSPRSWLPQKTMTRSAPFLVSTFSAAASCASLSSHSENLAHNIAQKRPNFFELITCLLP